MRRIILLLVILAMTGCAPYSADKLVKLPSNNQNPTIELVDLRPESEKTRAGDRGIVSIADDRRFNPGKVEYLRGKLSQVDGLAGKQIELLSFKHTIDTRSSTERIKKSGAFSGIIGASIAGSVASKNNDIIQCNIVLKIDDQKISSEKLRRFTLGMVWANYWENAQLREAAHQVTIDCVDEVLSKIRKFALQ